MTHDFIVVDDITKVHPGCDPEPRQPMPLFGAPGETVAFQIAFRSERFARTPCWSELDIRVVAHGSRISLSRVALQPARCPTWRDDPDDFEVTTPALVPDLLVPIVEDESAAHALIRPHHTGWNSIWIEIDLPAGGVDVEVFDRDTQLHHTHIDIVTLNNPIPPAPVSHLRWFHHDCLADHYGVAMWSNEHWQTIESQMVAAAKLGTTSIMIPLWTPPLDVQPGRYRKPTQLLGIKREGDSYRFDFSLARRWVETARNSGLTEVEVPHFFTQWGATSAASFYVDCVPGTPEVSASTKPTFGWHTDATDEDFQEFITQLIPQVREFLESIYDHDSIFWHMSDEPRPEHLDSYQSASKNVSRLLADVTVIDALSDPQYVPYVPTPVVATSEVERFREVAGEPRWVYYCVSQSTGQANQFLAQNGIRHRIQGFQFYKAQIDGFLHWGLNFYYSQWSKHLIDPLSDTDAGGTFLSGDPFIIYPGEGYQTMLSIRHRMIAAAWRDLALAYAAERIIGREAVLEIIDPDQDLDYATGFVSSLEYLNRRRHLFDVVLAASKTK